MKKNQMLILALAGLLGAHVAMAQDQSTPAAQDPNWSQESQQLKQDAETNSIQLAKDEAAKLAKKLAEEHRCNDIKTLTQKYLDIPISPETGAQQILDEKKAKAAADKLADAIFADTHGNALHNALSCTGAVLNTDAKPDRREHIVFLSKESDPKIQKLVDDDNKAAGLRTLYVKVGSMGLGFILVDLGKAGIWGLSKAVSMAEARWGSQAATAAEDVLQEGEAQVATLLVEGAERLAPSRTAWVKGLLEKGFALLNMRARAFLGMSGLAVSDWADKQLQAWVNRVYSNVDDDLGDKSDLHTGVLLQKLDAIPVTPTDPDGTSKP